MQKLLIIQSCLPSYQIRFMGNQLQKQYGLKEKPLKLSGSYNFLKFADHPSDSQTSLIIVKNPHRAGVVASDIILPIREFKPLGHDYSVAICNHCTPLALVRPRSEIETKLIIKEIIKLSSELGRIFYCSGRLMLWCEEVRSAWIRSPEEIETGKKSQKSNVFCAGICLINYLHFVYEKTQKGKKEKPKLELENFFNPKDKREYYQFVDNWQIKLQKTNFWALVSQGMKNLILVMVAKDPFDRIDHNTLLKLPYFSSEKQLRLYHMVADDLMTYENKEAIMLVETLEMIIKDRTIFDDLVLTEFLTPVLATQLVKKPDLIISCVVQLQKPPLKPIAISLKKVHPKNTRFFNNVLMKVERLFEILDQDSYDAGISRVAFCSFQCPQLHDKLMRVIPFLIKTMKESNLKKEIELQLILNVLENHEIPSSILLLGLKSTIELVKGNLLSNISKLFSIKFDPYKFDEDLEVNIHILELYQIMIAHIDHTELISVMIPKLEPYLIKEEVTDQLFFKAKKCVDSIMNRLALARELNPNDMVEVDYAEDFFSISVPEKPAHPDVVEVLRKEALKNKNEDINWLAELLEKQKPLADI